MGDKMDKELPKRKPTRLNYFDYNSSGAYFITICTENRRNLLSRIVGNTDKTVERFAASFVGGDVHANPQNSRSLVSGNPYLDAPNCNASYSKKRVELSSYGKIADKYINQLNKYYDNIKVDKYVIMPNHVHIMLFVSAGGASRTSPPTKQHSTVSRFISTFKRFCNKEIGKNIWQKSFHDHVIRNYEDYEEHIKYIHENPARWYFDELYSE